MKENSVLKFDTWIRNTACVEENLHELRTRRNVRDLIRRIATSEAARMAFVSKPRVSAPMVTNNPEMSDRGSKS